MTSFQSRFRRWLFVACAVVGVRAAESTDAELVYVDEQKVIRWRADDREVALFGANYCLPSSSDYRAAGYLGADRKKLIDQDMAHFARMGWNGLRLALWGDWENSDREGNLIANEHLDLFDYLLFRAKERGIFMLLTPIHRHTALWPDGKDSDAIQGFSKHYPARELGRNPDAIRAQQNYLRQFLNHVNPYTGVALKDEPAILFVEMINEPEHHSRDFEGSVAYINALADAVRSTGCKKLLFHNLSQDFRMGRAIAAAKVQGYSFGWYPTNLVAGRTLEGNYLRWVDRYSPLLQGDAPRMPSIVYEFDTGDMLAGYMYPAMVRSFRQAGAQFAAMFAYDMIATAPYNLGWQTHYLNLVYSPQKAVSAIIAAEAMRSLGRGGDYGDYPQNRQFGAFRVNYEENRSEMITAESFLHSNATSSIPPNPDQLRRIVGVGSSSVVSYAGNGSYFLEKVRDGVWRLEVYPDAVVVQDPFAQRLNYRSVSVRLIWREWPMKLELPDLGEEFEVQPVNSGNEHAPQVAQGRFPVRPGIYVLTAKGAAREPLPKRIGQIGFGEFVCPPMPDLPPQVVSHAQAQYPTGAPLNVDFDVVSAAAARRVELHVRAADAGDWKKFPAQHVGGYRYRGTIAPDAFPVGRLEFFVQAEFNEMRRFPEEGAWSSDYVAAADPLVIFDAGQDARRLFATRVSGDRAGPFWRQLRAEGNTPAAIQISSPRSASVRHAISLPIKSRINNRGAAIDSAKSLRLAAAGTAPSMRVTLVEADGTAWSAEVKVVSDWKEIEIPLSTLQLGNALKLPLGYPGNWNWELTPASDRGHADDQIHVGRIEHIQFVALPGGNPTQNDFVQIRAAHLRFE